MKRTAFRLAVSLLTLIAGATAAALLLYRQDTSSLAGVEVAARSQSAGQSQSVQSPDPSGNEADPLEAAFIKGDRLSYAGYDVERTFDAATEISSARIKKNGKTLVTSNNGGLGKDSTEIGLFPFLGEDTKQLVIMQYTGGAHCCWIYKIYDFSPQLRLLYDGERYGIDTIGYELRPKDIDGDGRYEFTQAVMTFDYFHMSHASSVFPEAVFSYDEKKRIYLPANNKFTNYLLEGLEGDLKKVEEERGKTAAGNERYLSTVLQVLLKYIYASQEATGWEFYHREYKLDDQREVEADLRKALQRDPIYLSIRRRGATP